VKDECLRVRPVVRDLGVRGVAHHVDLAVGTVRSRSRPSGCPRRRGTCRSSDRTSDFPARSRAGSSARPSRPRPLQWPRPRQPGEPRPEPSRRLRWRRRHDSRWRRGSPRKRGADEDPRERGKPAKGTGPHARRAGIARARRKHSQTPVFRQRLAGGEERRSVRVNARMSGRGPERRRMTLREQPQLDVDPPARPGDRR
jgi:hypothetical protein